MIGRIIIAILFVLLSNTAYGATVWVSGVSYDFVCPGGISDLKSIAGASIFQGATAKVYEMNTDTSGATFFVVRGVVSGDTSIADDQTYFIPSDLEAGGAGITGTSLWQKGAISGNTFEGKVFVVDARTVKGSDVDNWNTAYGYGDHSTAGYALMTVLSAYLASGAVSGTSLAQTYALMSQLSSYLAAGAVSGTSLAQTYALMSQLSAYLASGSVSGVSLTETYALMSQLSTYLALNAVSGSSIFSGASKMILSAFQVYAQDGGLISGVSRIAFVHDSSGTSITVTSDGSGGVTFYGNFNNSGGSGGGSGATTFETDNGTAVASTIGDAPSGIFVVGGTDINTAGSGNTTTANFDWSGTTPARLAGVTDEVQAQINTISGESNVATTAHEATYDHTNFVSGNTDWTGILYISATTDFQGVRITLSQITDVSSVTSWIENGTSIYVSGNTSWEILNSYVSGSTDWSGIAGFVSSTTDWSILSNYVSGSTSWDILNSYVSGNTDWEGVRISASQITDKVAFSFILPASSSYSTLRYETGQTIFVPVTMALTGVTIGLYNGSSGDFQAYNVTGASIFPVGGLSMSSAVSYFGLSGASTLTRGDPIWVFMTDVSGVSEAYAIFEGTQ